MDKWNYFTLNRRKVNFNHVLSIFHSIFSIRKAIVKQMKHPAQDCCVGISPPLSRGFKSSQSFHKEQTVAPARDCNFSWPSSIVNRSRLLPSSRPLNQLERDWEPLIKTFFILFQCCSIWSWNSSEKEKGTENMNAMPLQKAFISGYEVYVQKALIFKCHPSSHMGWLQIRSSDNAT